MSHTTRPLCVDLDGTLIRSDLLLESFLGLLKLNPLYLFLIPFWLFKGKAQFKAEIARRVVAGGTAPNATTLPWHPTFLPWLQGQKAEGRSLWLCTASNHALVQPIVDHLGLFDGVMASSDTHNLSGSHKAAKLVEQFGERGFDYCGNAPVDIKVWANAHGAIVVDGGDSLNQQVQQALPEVPVLARFDAKPQRFKALPKAFRLHQWAKNVLIFVPLLAAHQAHEASLLLQAIVAFFAFGLCASSVYLLNDLLDLNADRQHPRKCKRPFASGRLSLLTGILLTPALLAAGLLLAAFLPPAFLGALLVYYALTLAYSFHLKRQVLVDTLTLAALYTLRLVAGAKAISVHLSFWLLLFSIFLFLSLALVKRYAELHDLKAAGGLNAAGRGYHIEDLPILQSLGTAAGYLSVLVLALYINSADVLALYTHPAWIWGLCVLVLYWISRVWLIAHRGDMHDDPVVFALRDTGSLIVAALAALFVVLAV